MNSTLQPSASRARTRSVRAAMLALAAGTLAVAGSARAEAPAAYPAADVLAAFATACGTAEDQRASVAVLEASGWERLPAGADTPVSRLTAKGKAEFLALGLDAKLIEGGEYRKVVAGRTLYVALSGVSSDGVTALGCRLYDFDAPRAPTAEELGDWAARQPTGTDAGANGLHKVTYNPGLKPGHTTMEVNFVTPGTDPLPGFDLRGLTLVASVVEF